MGWSLPHAIYSLEYAIAYCKTNSIIYRVSMSLLTKPHPCLFILLMS